MKGWVYIISNPSLPGLIKIGFSMKDPDLRAEELDHSGVPYKYKVEYEILIDNPSEIEHNLHNVFHDLHEGKEWFRIQPAEAIRKIKEIYGKQIINEWFKNFKRKDIDDAIGGFKMPVISKKILIVAADLSDVLKEIFDSKGIKSSIIESYGKYDEILSELSSVQYCMVILTNTSLMPKHILELVPIIKQKYANIKILILSGYAEDNFDKTLISLGADAFMKLGDLSLISILQKITELIDNPER